MANRVDLTTTAFYYRKNDRKNPLSSQQFYHTGKGMFGGPRGTYGRYSVGDQVQPVDFKRSRER